MWNMFGSEEKKIKKLYDLHCKNEEMAIFYLFIFFNLAVFYIGGNKKAIAIDSRLSIAKVRYWQPAVNSELSLLTASYIFIYIIVFFRV